MTRAPTNFGDERRITETRSRDVDGNETFRTEFVEEETTDDNGISTTLRRGQNDELHDGTVWNPSYSARQTDPINIAVCQFCRHSSRVQQRHGYVSASNLKYCERCGEGCCPKHIFRCSDDAYRCRPCRRWYRAVRFATTLFFTSKD